MGPSAAGHNWRSAKTCLHQHTGDKISEAFVRLAKMSFFFFFRPQFLIRKFSYIGVNKMVNKS